jgi:hypothetical protein
MSRLERWSMSVLTAIVGVTGLAYVWMKYLLTPADPFAVVNHPWQPYVLDAHVLAAPALMIVFGMVWTTHIRSRVAAGQRYSRRTGLISLWTFILMAGSGYALPVLTGELARRMAIVVHLASGSVFLIAYGAHVVASFVRNRQRRQLRSAA